MYESLMIGLNYFFASQETKYFFLIFVLFVLPKFLTRFGIPQAITSFAFGIFCSQVLHLFDHDMTIKILGSLGIMSLFLFAGMEIDFAELKTHRKILLGHILFRIVSCCIVCFTTASVFSLDYRVAAILSLALLTPSAGFILDSLDNSKVLPHIDKFWIKVKAISGEIAALLAIFVFVNSSSLFDLSVASMALTTLLVFIPRVFALFSKKIAPYAPGSEFGFLLMMSVVCGVLTKKLGVYYLVGAFAVGVAARSFEGEGINTKSLMKSLKLFSSFFVPFYFFQAGLGISKEVFSLASVGYGFVFIMTIIPLRLYSIISHRKIALQETLTDSLPIATALLPNLVFGLVLADILHSTFHISQTLYGALIIYTIAATILPPIINKVVQKHVKIGAPVDSVEILG